jgi:hypothetical protein
MSRGDMPLFVSCHKSMPFFLSLGLKSLIGKTRAR